ncbi:hypothetical protein [Natronobacterium texcoconense]|uniref:Uncharacterized protein n=1 Tax=Natronobacterium texcoconense TaxID=1095778 RepID=A0A1H1FJH0_NATTX|nr:hypothetical protein [Natronobacterium texcoconense]SDR01037.1 hypothetical protein SAMN04489842_1992 [Natronobacterium texcoconense]
MKEDKIVISIIGLQITILAIGFAIFFEIDPPLQLVIFALVGLLINVIVAIFG